MKLKSLTLLIVVYKKALRDVPSYLSTVVAIQEGLFSGRVLVWDNSPEPLHCTDLLQLEEKDFSYRHTPENFPLSRVYNILLKEGSGDNYLILCDQDTHLSAAYWKCLANWLKTGAHQAIWLPKIYCGGELVSPGQFVGFKGRALTDIKEGPSKIKDTLAITSGMVLNVGVLRSSNIEFDERLKFYGIDTQLMLHLGRSGHERYVSSVAIEHDTALRTSVNGVEMQWRLWELEYAWRIILGEEISGSLKVKMHFLARRFRVCCQTQSLLPMFPKQRLANKV